MNYENVLKDNEKMIWKIASNFYGIDKDDLFQAGVVGLLKALKNYRTNDTTKFSTYAYDYIFGEMYTLANNRDIKISKDILKLYKVIETTRYKLAQKLNKIPSNLELSEYLDIPLQNIDFACMSANTMLSLDGDDEDARSAYETISGESVDMDNKILIDDSFSVLTEEEQDIIKSRYFEDLTQQEVARKLNMTQVMVSRYEKKGISKLRNYIVS